MASSEEKHDLRVGMIGLGCAKNLVDGELMLGHLEQAGVQITADPAAAEVVVGLALVVAVFGARRSVDVDELDNEVKV